MRDEGDYSAIIRSKATPWSLGIDRDDRLNPHLCREDLSLKAIAKSDHSDKH